MSNDERGSRTVLDRRTMLLGTTAMTAAAGLARTAAAQAPASAPRTGSGAGHYGGRAARGGGIDCMAVARRLNARV